LLVNQDSKVAFELGFVDTAFNLETVELDAIKLGKICQVRVISGDSGYLYGEQAGPLAIQQVV
jgi:hypothetical protein